jgi:hypothetical protein
LLSVQGARPARESRRKHRTSLSRAPITGEEIRGTPPEMWLLSRATARLGLAGNTLTTLLTDKSPCRELTHEGVARAI